MYLSLRQLFWGKQKPKRQIPLAINLCWGGNWKLENKQLEMDTFRAKTKFQLVLYPMVAAFDCYIYMCAYWEIKQEFLKQLTECEYIDCQRAPI